MTWDLRPDLAAEQIRRMAERIAVLIVSTDYPLVDIAVERSQLLDRVEELCPDRLDVFERIFESRFERLIEQWRSDEGMLL